MQDLVGLVKVLARNWAPRAMEGPELKLYLDDLEATGSLKDLMEAALEAGED